jgi:hypothetical protein
MLIRDFVRMFEILDALVRRDYPYKIRRRGAYDVDPKSNRPRRLRDQNHRTVCRYERHGATSAY